MDDHYFETRFVGADGKKIPPQRYRTLQGAMADIVGLSDGAHGSIWYQDEPGSEAVEVIRQEADGEMIDVQNDDGTNYPLNGVTEDIDPGPIDFSLWLEDESGRRTPYDFGFNWDGAHSADWQCSRGDSKSPEFPYCVGSISWSNQYDIYVDDQEEPDDLGDDLHVDYTSVAPSGKKKSGKAVIKNAAVDEAGSRDGWVAVAEELFVHLREKKLI